MSDEFLAFAAGRTGMTPERIIPYLTDYTAEVGIGLTTLSGVDLTGKRALEVGAGLGLLSLVLRQAGFDVTALEPGANGFDDNARLGAAVRAWLGAEDLPVFDVGAEDLDPAEHGRFDVMFSMNVLEHIPDLSAAVAAMAGVLAEGGMMVHMCPNYAAPYDPHYGIVLVPFAPRLTERLLPRLRDQGVWRSLNFVTASRVARMMRKAGLEVRFRRGMLYQAFARLDDDGAFAARHVGLVARVHRLLKQTRLLELLRFAPPAVATPMAFECRRAARRSVS